MAIKQFKAESKRLLDLMINSIYTHREIFLREMCIRDRVEGVKRLSGAQVEAPDLRGGAALVVAGLAAEGTTCITGVRHIDRGYEKIEHCLSSLGADVRRIVI